MDFTQNFLSKGLQILEIDSFMSTDDVLIEAFLKNV